MSRFFDLNFLPFWDNLFIARISDKIHYNMKYINNYNIKEYFRIIF